MKDKPTVESKRPRNLHRWITGTALLIVGLFFLFLFRFPVVINSPGPTFDVLGKNDAGIPLININGAKTYPDNNGKLLMTTVSTLGGPGSFVNGFDVISASLDPGSVVVPESEVYPPTVTSKQLKTIGAQQMNQSQLAAEAVALNSVGYEVPITWKVAEASGNPDATKVLKKGDILDSITVNAMNPMKIESIESLREYLSKVPPQTIVKLSIIRQDSAQVVSFPTVKSSSGSGSQLGVLLDSQIKIPLDIKFHLKDVGGPSAGTMFALGIVEQLSAEKLSGKHVIAGTGTIDLSGKVGSISGIAQKMVGARQDGAEFFLAPVDNCNEVIGNIPEGLRVTPIATFDNAIQAVKQIRDGKGSKLPSCPAETR